MTSPVPFMTCPALCGIFTVTMAMIEIDDIMRLWGCSQQSI